jgi:trimethylamine:corrinoid methyltransferase-like protein
MLKVADEKKLDKLHEGVLDVLKNTGIKLYSDYLLRELQNRGCDVDLEEGVVRLSPDIVERQIKAQSNRYKMVRSSLWDPFCEREPEGTVSFPDEFICDYGHAARSIYDYSENVFRTPVIKDQVEMTRLGNAIDSVRGVCAPFLLMEFDGRIEALESARILMNNTPKPGWVGTYSGKQLRYLKQLAEIAVDGNKDLLRTVPPIVVTVMCTTSPLRIDNRSCDVLEEALKHEFPINFASMPIMGEIGRAHV